MPRPASDKTTINMRIPHELLSRLEACVNGEYYGYQDRSSAIQMAVEFLLDSKECINCGTLNSGCGKYCSRCGMRLYTDKEIKELMLCAYKYGLVVTSPAAYENGAEPIPDNNHFHVILSYINEYTSQGLIEVLNPVIDRNFSYYDVRRYKIKVSFRLKDSNTEVLPKREIEFYIPYRAIEIVMIDQFKKFKSCWVGDDGIPSTENLIIHTEFSKNRVGDTDEAMLKFLEIVKERYLEKVVKEYGDKAKSTMLKLDPVY